MIENKNRVTGKSKNTSKNYLSGTLEQNNYFEIFS
jgi:hypothetical protein